MKRLIQILLMTLVFTLSASADEDLVGLQYWDGLSMDAITTSSGLQYKIQIPGKGRKPELNDKVVVHYRGLLLNGAEFDSSYSDDEPVTLTLRRAIKGWGEGVQLMSVGGVFVFLIPPELGYGEKGWDSIPPNAPLIFVVELYGIK